tara:strand:- start:55 stop:201 length:147 start_codon:yes stop_codon:yes gene_type:complete
MKISNIIAVIPTPQKVWNTYYEAINPDSLDDAFEVADDEMDRIYNSLR